MAITDLEAKVKFRFRITTTALDKEVTDACETAVAMLAPYVKKSAVATATVDSDAEDITVPTAGSDVRKLQVSNDGASWHALTDYFKEGDQIYFTGHDVEAGDTVRFFLRAPYAVADYDTIPAAYLRPLADLASAEFASIIAGDKARYNIYSQSNGARAVDNMLDLAEFYETRADKVLSQIGTSEGLS